MFMSKIMRRRAERDAATAFVDWAIRSGKPIKCVRGAIIAAHRTHAVETERFVHRLPTISRPAIHGQATHGAATVAP